MIDKEWKRPKDCGNGGCAEVRRRTRYRFQSKQDSQIQIRSSRRSSTVEFEDDEWLAFIAAVKDGEYDL